MMSNQAAAVVVAAEEPVDEEKTLQIILPVLISAVVGGMWFFKTQGATPTESNSSTVQNDPFSLPEHLQDADFSLAITEAVGSETLAEYGIPVIIDHVCCAGDRCQLYGQVDRNFFSDLVHDFWRFDGADGFADLGAFLAGILGGIFSSPCSTPVLIALLAIVAGESNLFWKILLMLVYSVGHSALVIVAGTSIGFVQRINARGNYKTVAPVSKNIMGALILLMCFYVFWLVF